MVQTGIVRKIDEMGRIVIPSEIRKQLRMKIGDSIEICLDNGDGIKLKKYSNFFNLEGICKSVAKTIWDKYKNPIVITDTQQVIAMISDHKRNGYKNKQLTKTFCDIIESRKRQAYLDCEIVEDIIEEDIFVFPIIANGDLYGTLTMICKNKNSEQIDVDMIDLLMKVIIKEIED